MLFLWILMLYYTCENILYQFFIVPKIHLCFREVICFYIVNMLHFFFLVLSMLVSLLITQTYKTILCIFIKYFLKFIFVSYK